MHRLTLHPFDTKGWDPHHFPQMFSNSEIRTLGICSIIPWHPLPNMAKILMSPNPISSHSLLSLPLHQVILGFWSKGTKTEPKTFSHVRRCSWCWFVLLQVKLQSSEVAKTAGWPSSQAAPRLGLLVLDGTGLLSTKHSTSDASTDRYVCNRKESQL